MPRPALGLLFFMLLTSTAWAGVTPAPSTSVAPSSSTKAAAREAFMAAMKLYEAGDYAGALSKFSEAWALIPVSTVRLNIARCQEKLGRTATAWAEYKATAADAKVEGKTKVETQANDGAAALEPKVPWLTITVTPSDALVKVDGEGVASGVASPVDPGARVVTAQKGAKSKKVTVVVAEGDKKKIAVAL